MPARRKDLRVKLSEHVSVPLTPAQNAYLARRARKTGENKSTLLRLLLMQDMLARMPLYPIRESR